MGIRTGAIVVAVRNIGGVSRPFVAKGTMGTVVRGTGFLGTLFTGPPIVEFEPKDNFERDSVPVRVMVNVREVRDINDPDPIDDGLDDPDEDQDGQNGPPSWR